MVEIVALYHVEYQDEKECMCKVVDFNIMYFKRRIRKWLISDTHLTKHFRRGDGQPCKVI